MDDHFRVYLTRYRVLRANQDARSEEVMETAYHLMRERATHINDESLQRSFLESELANRRILEPFGQGRAEQPLSRPVQITRAMIAC
jgi:hypothetical protein